MDYWSAAALGLAIGVAPVPWPEEESMYAGNENRCGGPIAAGAFRILNLRVGYDSVDAAEKTLRRSPLKTRGDGHGNRAWRCWQAANGDGTVLYVARGEIHEELRILGAEIAFPERESCPKSKLVHRKLVTANGLGLGLNRKQVEQKIGAVSTVRPGWYEKACYGRRPMTEGEEKLRSSAPEGSAFFEISSSIRIVEKDGIAVGLESSWAEST